MAQTVKPNVTEAELDRLFPTEDACKTYLTQLRWPDGKVHCARCNLSLKVYALKARPFHWVCKHCGKNGYRFSVLTGTIFENTNVPLRTWFQVIHKMCHSKKGISALQVYRIIDPVRGKTGSYRTAWYMCHRIRAAMIDDGFLKLTGVVEVDETYIGGKNKNRHGGGRGMLKRTGKRSISRADKSPVIGAISRKGNVVCQAIDMVSAKTMTDFVRQTVDEKVSLVATDEHVGYKRLGRMGFPHESVSHVRGEYVRGNVHTANLDSF